MFLVKLLKIDYLLARERMLQSFVYRNKTNLLCDAQYCIAISLAHFSYIILLRMLLRYCSMVLSEVSN